MRVNDNIEIVSEFICSQEDEPGTHKSQRQIAETLGCAQSSVHNIVKNDLKLKAFKRIKTSRKTTAVKTKRKQRARLLLDRFDKKEVESIVFTDEKDFTFEIKKNRQNNPVYGEKKRKLDIPPSRLYHEENSFSKKLMVLGGVSWYGKTDIHFIDPGTKVNKELYIELLDKKLLPDCRQLHPNGFILQQDGASSHTSDDTQNYLRHENINYITKDQWPPSSPDLNPMDYCIWNLLKEKVYKGEREPFDLDSLKSKIRESWESISLLDIRKAIKKWKKRLRLVIQEEGGPIEHCRV